MPLNPNTISSKNSCLGKMNDNNRSETDLPAFGDVSAIGHVHDDTTAMFAHTLAEARAKAVIYNEAHKADIKLANKVVKLKASSQLPFTGSLSDVLATKGLVCSCPTDVIPRVFKRDQLKPGEQINVERCSAAIKKELGRGSYGVVALLQASDQSSLAVKVQKPVKALAWEYEIMQRLEHRLGHRPIASFPRPLSFLSLADGAMLSMTLGSDSGLNLVDLVNVHMLKLNDHVPEIIVLYYTSIMLKQIYILHCHGKVLHTDTKPDNWVLTSSSQLTGTPVEASDLMLVDFGRAVDLDFVHKDGLTTAETKLYGDATSKPMRCVAMRKEIPWCYDADTFGVCAASHVLLFGKHIEIEKDTSSRRWRITEKLEPYMQEKIWGDLFDQLLNVDELSLTANGSHPSRLRDIWEPIDAHVNSCKAELIRQLQDQASKMPSCRSEL